MITFLLTPNILRRHRKWRRWWILEHMYLPAKHVINIDPQVLIRGDLLDVLAIDRDRTMVAYWSRVKHHFFSFFHIDDQEVLIAPVYKGLHSSRVTAHAGVTGEQAKYGCVIWEFHNVLIWLGANTVICKKGEQKGHYMPSLHQYNFQCLVDWIAKVVYKTTFQQDEFLVLWNIMF